MTALFVVVVVTVIWSVANLLAYAVSARDIGPVNWRILLGPKVYLDWAFAQRRANR